MVIHAATAGAAALRKLLLRQCPQCHHRMLVKPSQKDETVACEKCETPVPPKTQKAERS